MLVASSTPAVFAETTTLTTTVPTASYTLNIPANQEIEYGSTNTKIGNVTVTDGKNFAEGKNVEVTINYTSFTSEDTTTTINYALDGYGILNRTQQTYASKRLSNGSKLVFKGTSNGAVTSQTNLACTLSTGETYTVAMEYISVVISSTSWGKASAGNYSSVITFSSEIVTG